MWAVANMFAGAGAPDRAAGVDSVRAHLQQLLNTRQGQALASPCYGLEGGAARLANLLQRWPHSCDDLEAAVAAAIAAHEPRLQALRWCAPALLQPCGLTLHLAARLKPANTPVAWALRVSPRGHVQVLDA